MKNSILEHYDWIILGDHPACLWAALSLVESGLNVLVVPQFAEDVSDQPHTNESNWCPHFITSANSEPIQVITPTRRFQIGSTEEEFNQEWKTVFGSSLTPSQFNQPELKHLVKGFGFVARGHDLCPVLPDDWKRVLQGAKDQRFFQGGRSALKKFLLDKISKLGGRVVEENCQRIFVEEKGFKGIQLHGVSKMISSPACMLGLNWNSAQPYFSETNALKSDPMAWWFTLQFEIPEEMVPVGATAKMIYSEADAPVVEIERHLKNWRARTLLPYHIDSLDRNFQRKIAERLFKLLESIFPFIEYSVSRLVPDIRDPERVESYDLVQLYPFRDLTHIPDSLLAYGGKGIGHVSPYPGLYHAYDESYPRLGDSGSYQAAALAMMDWAKKSQKVLPDHIKKAIIT